MLNNPLSTYAELGQCNRPTTNCIVFGTACLCLSLGFLVPTDWYLQVEEPPTSPCRGVVHRSKRKGYAMHESFLVCSSTPMSCVSFVKYSAHLMRAVKDHPLRQHRLLPMQAQAGCTE